PAISGRAGQSRFADPLGNRCARSIRLVVRRTRRAPQTLQRGHEGRSRRSQCPLARRSQACSAPVAGIAASRNNASGKIRSTFMTETMTKSGWTGTRFGKPQVGARAERRRITRASDVIAFSDMTGDRNPLHYDEALASRSVFGRLIVQGGVTSGL